MRAVVQRVTSATVTVGSEVVGAIDRGLLVYLGAGSNDTDRDVDYVARKLIGLRIFVDTDDKMSLSVADVGGEMLIVSQFTLYGDVRRGRRPSFDGAAAPDVAKQLYDGVCAAVRAQGVPVATGVFRASMKVECIVDGPVTILVDSTKTF